ncbi:MAG: bifunctional phosphoglucose/phosphomannose isomerase [Halanaerobium sp.]|nr:bifunctional phosphoglucose/phosphomannose isomerase [Halanaerobium sp.]
MVMSEDKREILNDFQRQQAIDPAGMARLTIELPEQMKEAWEIGQKAPLPEMKEPANIVIGGMGGSAIGGDILRTLLADELKVPVVVNRDYHLPAFVGEKTLVVMVSYSGNTEETLSSFREAVARGASIVALTSNGRLEQASSELGIPVIKIPGGISPRAAIGYTFLPVLAVACRLGLVADREEEVREMIALLQEMSAKLHPARQDNQAKKIALALYQKLPVIYGSQGWKGVVAQRWKCQLNENSKAPAYWNEYPELNHNETVGWEACPELTTRFVVINLRDERDQLEIKKRFDITTELIEENADRVIEVYADGKSKLARMFSLIYLGDFVSIYLAYLYGIDPTPVKVIDLLKKRLKKD